ncbi:MAG: hypothetical protein HYY24_21465 [Verrucomicrobia bacterium]|nr:hypothetical protein [Verrucomicrobiota bacterium]
MTPEQNELLKTVYRNLADRPLEPDDAFYEPIYKLNPDTDEPVDRMQKKIDWAEGQSIQFFSGFRGAGKTTELKRLQQRLEQGGCLVIFANALDYINPSARIDITDLLPVLAGAFSDRLKNPPGGKPLLHESYWTRFKAFLTRTKVEMEEVTLSAGEEVGAEIKLAMRTNPTFRQQIQKALSAHLTGLRQETTRFFEDAVKAIRAQTGDDKKIVFIFDSLEQVRGSLSNETEVIRSVESLFSNHLDALRLPYLHVVYTVPPWLKFLLKNLSVEIIPSVRQWLHDTQRTPDPTGNAALQRALERRLKVEGFGAEPVGQVLGQTWPVKASPASLLVASCGGHFRDLFLLLREALVRARTLPLAEAAVEESIAWVRRNFLPLAIEDARWLARIADTRHPSYESADDAGRLARFLDTHIVLYFSDREEWYDVHPLVRPEVDRILKLQAAAKPSG